MIDIHEQNPQPSLFKTALIIGKKVQTINLKFKTERDIKVLIFFLFFFLVFFFFFLIAQYGIDAQKDISVRD